MQLLEKLESVLSPRDDAETEADTRARRIDPLLLALGWTGPSVRREPYAGWSDDRGFIDYLLLVGGAPLMVLEAKKSGRDFEIPDAIRRSGTSTYGRMRQTGSSSLVEALEQCVRYATHAGASYACATNGFDFIFFKPHHHQRPLGEAKCIVFSGLESIARRIDQFEVLATRASAERGGLDEILVGSPPVSPTFAKRLSDVVSGPRTDDSERAEYSRLLDEILQNYLIDVQDDEAFWRSYVPVDVNRSTVEQIDALIYNQELSVQDHFQMDAEGVEENLTVSFSGAKAPSGRVVVLHGSIGAGKSSFLRYLRTLQRKKSRSKRTLWAIADLLPFKDRPFDSASAADIAKSLVKRIRLVLTQAAESLPGNYDPEEWRHLRDIYNDEVRRLQKSLYPNSDDSNEEYLARVRDHIYKLREDDPHDHLIRTLRWLTRHCGIPTVVAFDNSDQLGLDFQEYLFKLAETIRSDASAVILVSLRTEALVTHRLRAHADAVVFDGFEVRTPALVEILQARFRVIKSRLQRMVEKKNENYRIAAERLDVLLDVLMKDAKHSGECSTILDEVGNANLRVALQAVALVFKHDPREMDRLVARTGRGQRADINPSYVRRSILRSGGRYRSDAPGCLVPNIYQVDVNTKIPYTLQLRVLQHLETSTGADQRTVERTTSDFVRAGANREIVANTIRRARASSLVLTAHMNASVLETDYLTLSKLGRAVANSWFRDPEYLTAVMFDTYLYDAELHRELLEIWRDSATPWPTRFLLMRTAFARALEADDVRLRGVLSSDIISVLRVPLRLSR